jgi:hypothetical protein
LPVTAAETKAVRYWRSRTIPVSTWLIRLYWMPTHAAANRVLVHSLDRMRPARFMESLLFPRCPGRNLQWSEDACFHLMNRGHNPEAVFTEDEDRRTFLDLVARDRDRFGFQRR